MTDPKVLMDILALGGPVAGVVMVVYLMMSVESRRREKDRTEHVNKWDSMVSQNREALSMLIKNYEERILLQMTSFAALAKSTDSEKERLFKLNERQLDALETHSRLLAVINQKIDTNQFCPTIRSNGK